MSGKVSQNFSFMDSSLSPDTDRPLDAINFTEILRLAQSHVMFKIGTTVLISMPYAILTRLYDWY